MKIFLLLVICCVFSWSKIECSVFREVNVTTEASDEIVLEKWSALLGKVKTITDDVLRMVVPMAIRLSSEVEISTECQATLLKLVFALRKGEYWAIKMLDVSGKPFSGITQGNIADYGSYQGCLDIQLQNDYREDIRGQYCLLDLRPPLPKKPARFNMGELIKPFSNLTMAYKNEALTELLSYVSQLYKFPVRLGVCLPSTCTKDDIKNVANYGASQIGVYADVSSCEVETPFTFNTQQLTILSIFGLFVFLVAFGTIFDVSCECLKKWMLENSDDPKKCKYSPSTIGYILKSLSIRRNLSSLMNCERSHDDLGFLNGVKASAMIAIIFGHVHVTHEYHALREPRPLSESFDKLDLQPIINGRLHVETFVFVSALLFSYLTLKNKDKIGTNILTQIILIIRRMWRLQPMLFIVIGFVILSPIVGSGPLWNESLLDMVDKCNSDWWKALLFLNNIFSIGDICLSISWYVSMDMQLFVISCVIYILYSKMKILAYLVLAALYILSIIPIVAFTYLNPLKYPATYNLRTGEPIQLFDMADKTTGSLHLHFGIYVIGIITGALLAKKTKISIPLGCRTMTWIVTFIGFGLISLGTGKWSIGQTPDPIVAVLYAATYRTVWALGLAWLSIACFYGYGGYIDDLLSWSFFVPLSRLSYIIYLVHVPIIQTFNASTYGVVDYRQTLMVFNSFAIVTISVIVSIIMYVIFECPLKLVDKILFANALMKLTKKEEKTHNGKT